MTNTMLKTLIFCGGALVGSAVTYLLCKKSEKDRVDQLVADYEAEFRKMSESFTADNIPDEAVRSDEDPMKFQHEKKTDYTGYFKPDTGPSIYHPEYEENIEEQSYAGDTHSSGPQAITSYAYANNEWGYVQESMLYYIDDDCLVYTDGHHVDDDGHGEPNDYLDYQPIDIKDQLVGDENLELFELTDTDTIWVKNDAYQRLYEIELMNGPCPIHDWD